MPLCPPLIQNYIILILPALPRKLASPEIADQRRLQSSDLIASLVVPAPANAVIMGTLFTRVVRLI